MREQMGRCGDAVVRVLSRFSGVPHEADKTLNFVRCEVAAARENVAFLFDAGDIIDFAENYRPPLDCRWGSRARLLVHCVQANHACGDKTGSSSDESTARISQRASLTRWIAKFDRIAKERTAGAQRFA